MAGWVRRFPPWAAKKGPAFTGLERRPSAWWQTTHKLDLDTFYEEHRRAVSFALNILQSFCTEAGDEEPSTA
jgi:hypothetical protein